MAIWRGVDVFPSNCDEESAQQLIDVEVDNGGSSVEIRDRIVEGMMSPKHFHWDTL